MILIGQYDSPFVRRVAIALHLQGFEFKRNPLSVFSDAAEMARINPLGRVPSLVLDDGEVLTDSGAIIDHLDEVVGADRALVPRAGAERRRALQIAAVACGAAEKAVALVYERLFHAPEMVSQDWQERCRGQLETALGWLETRCDGGWFLPGRLTIADVTTGAVLGFLKLRVPEIQLARDFEKLERVSETCEALPAFFRTRPTADDVMPSR